MNSERMRLTILFALLTLGAAAHAEMSLRTSAEYMPAAAGHQGHGHGRAPVVHIRDGADAVVGLWTPELKVRSIEASGAERITVQPTGMNNYHALVATREGAHLTEVALRYLHFNGRPADKTPSSLVAREKAELEIVPDPLPREHWRYLGGETVRFLVRYRGRPVANHAIDLYTTNGTLIQGRTGANGRWEVPLPDDFAEVRPGRQNNRPGEFVVRTRLDGEARSYRTTLSAAYSVNPSHWQSTGLGALALSGGFLSGLLVLRRAGRGGAA
jgi:hypothetical protein